MRCHLKFGTVILNIVKNRSQARVEQEPVTSCQLCQLDIRNAWPQLFFLCFSGGGACDCSLCFSECETCVRKHFWRLFCIRYKSIAINCLCVVPRNPYRHHQLLFIVCVLFRTVPVGIIKCRYHEKKSSCGVWFVIGTLALTTCRQPFLFELKQASLMSCVSTQPLARRLTNCCLNVAPVLLLLLIPTCFECNIWDCRS